MFLDLETRFQAFRRHDVSLQPQHSVTSVSRKKESLATRLSVRGNPVIPPVVVHEKVVPMNWHKFVKR